MGDSLATGALPDEPRRLVLRLDRIKIEGFKVYTLATNIGPLQHFSCVIGPNGIGKSVLGEAIAFGLGANARMLRVKTLAGVISSSLGEDGQPLSKAEVTLSFLMIDPLAQRIVGQFHIRRRVTRSNRSTFHVAACVAPLIHTHYRTEVDAMETVLDDSKNFSNTGGEDEAEENEDGDFDFPEDSHFVETSHASLAIILDKYGLDVKNGLERVIVTQHRRAVEVADPKKLVKFIESLIGGAGAQQKLEELTTEYAAAHAEEDRLDDQYGELVNKTEQLYPALHQWKRFNENKLKYQERVATVCRKRAVLLEKESKLAGEEAENAEKKLESIETAQETARIKADELLLVKEKADDDASAAVAEQKNVVAQHQTALEELERAKARERSAEMTFKRATAAVSSTIAAVNPTPTTGNQKKKKKAATAGRVQEDLGKKAEKLENEVAAVEQELEMLEKERVQLRKESVENTNKLPLEMQQARKSWKEAEGRATAAAATAQVAAKKSSEATAAVFNATSALEKQRKTVSTTEKAVEKWNDSISELEIKLCALENDEKKAHAAAEEAEKNLASHSIKGMKLETALKDSFKALAAAGIDADEPEYTKYSVLSKNNKNQNQNGGQSVDAAVAALAQQAQHDDLNPLTGAFHGRVHSVLRVLNPQASNAVNAVLLEKCNPASALVTSTRSAAETVVSYFKENKVGIATCTVLEELRSTGSTGSGSNGKEGSATASDAAAVKLLAPILNKTPGAICPLSMLIQPNTDVPGSSLLVSDVFANWYLVSDPLSAAKIMDQDRKKEKVAAAAGGGVGGGRRNLVTLCGSLFKCDGEICAPKEDAFLKMKEKYLLSSDFVEIGCSENLTGGFSSSFSLQNSKEIEQMVEKLKAEHDQAVATVNDHELATEAIEEHASAAHAMLGSTQTAVSSMKHNIEVALKALQKETKALTSARSSFAKAEQRYNAASSKAEKFLAACLDAEAVATQCAAQRDKLHQVYVDQAQNEPAAKNILSAEQALVNLRSRCDKAENRKSTLQTELSSIQANLQVLCKASHVLGIAEKDVSESKSNVREATVDVAEAEENLQQAENALKERTAAKNEATKNWRDAVKLHQTALQAHQKTLAAIHDARTREQTAMRTAVDMGKESADALKQVNYINAKLNKAGEVLGSFARKEEKERRKEAGKEADDDELMDDDDDDGYCNSTTSSDVECEQVFPKSSRHSSANRAAAATRSSAQNLSENQKRQNEADLTLESDDSADDDDSEWEEEEVTRAMAELAQQNRALESLALEVDTAGAAEAIGVHTQLIQVHAALQKQESKVQKLSVQIAEARTARYLRFSSAMDAAAVHLSETYQKLTGNIGDAHCRYDKDENAVFEQGVKFIVRPDNGTWRPFASLSGGQQALAALSLCFALQKVAPSPFYFFDEIDAALDTINSQRVAEFLRDLCENPYSIQGGMAPQIIAVSHRVAPQAAAHCILAVHSTSDFSAVQQGERHQQTGIMTLYPSSYAGTNAYLLQCEETGRQQFLYFNRDSWEPAAAGEVFEHGAGAGIQTQEGDKDYLEAILQMMFNAPFSMTGAENDNQEDQEAWQQHELL